MSVAQNKEMFRRWIEEGWNGGNLSVVDELFAPDYVSHAFPPTFPPNQVGLKQFVSAFRTAFPGLQWTLHDMVGEGDNVIARFTGAATHRGEFMGIPATGKAFSVMGFLQARFEDGKWAEDWVSWDQLGMLQQLGVVPTQGTLGRAESMSTEENKAIVRHRKIVSQHMHTTIARRSAPLFVQAGCVRNRSRRRHRSA